MDITKSSKSSIQKSLIQLHPMGQESASSESKRVKSWLLCAILMISSIAMDQALKLFCRAEFINNQSTQLIEGWEGIHLTRIMNPGLMFHALSGIPKGENELYIRYLPTLAMIAFVSIFAWARGLGRTRAERIGFALLTAGGISNLWNHWTSYYVMDTLKILIGKNFQYQPFNLADAWITLGLILIVATQGAELLRSFRSAPTS